MVIGERTTGTADEAARPREPERAESAHSTSKLGLVNMRRAPVEDRSRRRRQRAALALEVGEGRPLNRISS
jgi:hypothetical protein